MIYLHNPVKTDRLCVCLHRIMKTDHLCAIVLLYYRKAGQGYKAACSLLASTAAREHLIIQACSTAQTLPDHARC